MEVSGLPSCLSLFTLEEITSVPIDNRVGGPQSRYGCCDKGKGPALVNIEPQSPNLQPSKFQLVLFSLIVFYDSSAFERK
jgi:hypothetical protein